MDRVYEARIVRIKRGKWRWDVIRYAVTDLPHLGVFGARIHLWGECGYTCTWIGAALKVARWVSD